MKDAKKTDSNRAEAEEGKGVSRRRIIQGAGVAAAAAAITVGAKAAAAAAGDGQATEEAGYTVPTGFTGTMADLKHVVILMQENRSFDHYFGQLPGVRGHNDKQSLKFQDGTTVFQQRDASHRAVDAGNGRKGIGPR